MNCVIMYGPPTSGKTKTALELSARTGYSYLSVGNITRSEISKGTADGILLKACLDAVVEYPPELIARVVESRLRSLRDTAAKGVILDGFPKYKGEVGLFLTLCDSLSIRIDKVIVLDLGLKEALRRASLRRICGECLTQFMASEAVGGRCPACGGEMKVRDDDQPKNLERRYRDHSLSLRETLDALGDASRTRADIDAGQKPEDVLQCVVNALV
ncbi:MAG: nucleoside monophosphate kinase [Candidatus Taylorbacteria bacterium]|nr:nucleoside monophosphate kinase [Candidatus Taylorbacteria bacterium]